MASEAEKRPPRSPEVMASKLNVQFFLTHSTWFQVSRRSNNEVMRILSLPMLNKTPCRKQGCLRIQEYTITNQIA